MRLSPLDVALNVLMFGLAFLGADALGAHFTGSPTWLGPEASASLAAGSIGVGVCYMARQRRQAHPLFPLDLLRIPVFALSMCTSIGAFAAQTLAYVCLPFLMLEAWSRSHAATGLLITAWPIATVLTAPIAGRLIGRVADGLLGAVGLALFAAGLAALALLPASPGDTDIVWRMALCGLGFGLFQSPNNHTIVTTAPASRSGAASGMLGTARLTGQTIGSVLLAAIFGAFGAHSPRGPTVALAIAAVFAAVAGAFSGMRVRAASRPPGAAVAPLR
jgi:MFS transporter, DHA2 family, multidrug resistance protein